MKTMINVLYLFVCGSFGFGGFYPTNADVIELSEENFQRLVINSGEVWIVKFYRDGCPHCKAFLPEYQNIAKALTGVVKIGAINKGGHKELAEQYGVTEVPTLVLFGPDKNKPEVLHGKQTAKSIVDIAIKTVNDKVYDRLLNKFSGEGGSNGVKRSTDYINELTDSHFEKACKEHRICIIAVVPHILDCLSDCRNGYLKMLDSLSDKYKKSNWGWAWSEAMAHPELESALDIGGSGYPALVALNANKMQYALFRGSFSNDDLNDFLRHIASGRGHTSPLRSKTLPAISKIEPWNGKDGTMSNEEEDFSKKNEPQIQLPFTDDEKENEPQIELPYPYNKL